MSKIKLSFSLLLTIFLVGILSTAVFASSAYGLSVSYDQTIGFTFKFTKISTDPANDFLLTISKKDAGASSFARVSDTPIHGVGTSAYSFPAVNASDIVKGSIYKFELKTADGSSDLGIKYAVVTTSNNLHLANVSDDLNLYTATGKHLDVDGSGLPNSNHTGQDSVKKPSQKTHGFYQNNTNSCASCHQTHTAANGESLLFKDGVYSTCSACHDGTTGAYNAFAPSTASTTNSLAGTFNVQQAGHNGSLHQADGSLEVSAAPGGNNSPVSTDSKSVNANTWGAEFDCASCHAPHGAGSASENNLNIDPQGWGGVQYYKVGATKADGTTATLDDSNGKLFKNIPIYDKSSIPATMDTPFILVKFTAAASDISTDKTKTGYLYSRAGVQTGDQIIQTYRWDGSKYVADYSLWLRDVGHVNAPFQNANTVLKDSTSADITATNMTVIWRDGFAFGAGVANVTKADVSIGIDVETNSKDIAALYDSTDKNYIVDSGTEMSKYCSACHTDYLSGTRTNNTGVYTVAHRHATAQDRLTCVRCHYAHGSEATILHDANDNTYFSLTAAGKVFDANVPGNTDKALSYFVDPNPSSALKRYTGMSVCYACHGKGEQFLGNPNVNADSATGQFLKNGDPGVVGPTGTNPGDGRTDLPTRHNASGSDLTK